MEQAFKPCGKIALLRVNRLDYVPTGLYAAELLAERGHEVLAIEYGFFQRSFETQNQHIARLRLGHPWLRRLPGPARSILVHAFAFLRIAALFARHGRPALILSEGLHEQALAYGLSLLFRIPFACHVHEVYETATTRGWNRFFLALEGPSLRAASFLIFPESDRARLYYERHRLDQPTCIAFNCPRRRPPANPVDWRARLGLARETFLLGYWGGQGKMNALEQGIRAVARIPNTYFLLWGWSSPADREYFKKLASGVGAGHRILFLGELPQDKWSAIAGLDASYCLYEPVELRFRHLATASNKLMESLAVGVPVLTSGEPDFQKVVDFYGVGACTQGYTVDAIARGIRELAQDEPRRKRCSANALRAHRELLHYEHQFQAVLRQVERVLERRARVSSAARFPEPTKV